MTCIIDKSKAIEMVNQELNKPETKAKSLSYKCVDCEEKEVDGYSAVCSDCEWISDQWHCVTCFLCWL